MWHSASVLAASLSPPPSPLARPSPGPAQVTSDHLQLNIHEVRVENTSRKQHSSLLEVGLCDCARNASNVSDNTRC